MTFGRPELELGVTGGADADDQIPVILANSKPVDDLRVTAIEALGQAQQGREHAHDAAALAVQSRKAGVCLPWRGLAMIAGDQSDDRNLVALEAA
jgi:hypothetical protein